jgi:trehalose 2-sulfotransferase
MAGSGRRSAHLPIWTSPAATYIICTNPRSGSWLLSDALTLTGVAGRPREWFNVTEEQRYRARWRMHHSSDLSYLDYLRIARAESTTQNGISGIKLHYYQLDELRKTVAARAGIRGLTDAQLLPRLFPKARYLWLRRRDQARQAISFFIASRSDEWWVIEGAAPEKHAGAVADPEFDPRAIAWVEAALRRCDRKWQSFFQDTRTEPLVVHYEDLAADYPGVVQGVLKWLGIPNSDAIGAPSPRLARQSNARNEEWLARYLAFKDAGGEPAQDSDSIRVAGQLLESVKRPFNRIPEGWKRWVAHAKLRNTKDEEIVEVLVSNGYTRDSAIAQVKGAAAP